ncbi:Aste57867_10025 [Aphanomyces stellatus]|uniref:Aste57867_10025 protein n=1 Tax=Aphanomyces stellatus TaxID=120398 RepID=A0A485KQ06_9STRA|nr:hypothetical protein As57867_009986 [Aphanomyces stellatus]VFT86903.1 Aste57867_10025 [Aphanomyces stellatus]
MRISYRGDPISMVLSKKAHKLVLRGGLEAALLLLYGAPQFIIGRSVQDVEYFRLICSSLVTTAACLTTTNAGVLAFVHCVFHIYSNASGPWSAWMDTIFLIARLVSFERLLSVILFPRVSYEARLRDNTVKLKRFFHLHDPSRVGEAESLLLEYIGNEPLLFHQLRQKRPSY